MISFRRAVRLVGRALFVALVALAAGFAPMAALPFLYLADGRRPKEVAALIVHERK